MSYILKRIIWFIMDIPMRLTYRFRSEIIPPIPYHQENWLIQKLNPVIYNENLSDSEKSLIMKDIIENFNPIEY